MIFKVIDHAYPRIQIDFTFVFHQNYHLITVSTHWQPTAWDDKYKAGAYAALSIACSDLEKIDQE